MITNAAGIGFLLSKIGQDLLTPSSNLIVGGTGMLKAATRWVIGQSDRTVLVARHASRFDVDNSRLTRLDLNWNGDDFRSNLEGAVRRVSPIACALLWLHDPHPILPWLLPLLPEARIVLVLGSQAGNPQVIDAAKSLITVRLGSKAVSGVERRWLTDTEISDGAIRALTSGKSQIIGDLISV